MLPARGVIVAGQDEGTLGAQAAAAAERLGYPLLADPLSGARHGATAIATYDLLLREPDPAWRPDVVVRVGDLPTSKPLRAWLATLDSGIDQIAVDPQAAWQDPDAVVSEVTDGWGGFTVDGRDPEWLGAWLAADGPRALRWPMCSAASSPNRSWRDGWASGSPPLGAVRGRLDADPRRGALPARPLRPAGCLQSRRQRIDGTVAAAFGVAAAAAGTPGPLLIGDVALAHDIGGLLAARRLGLQLTIVLLNNDGGGIFHFLPVSGEGEAFEEHVATPHGLDFAQVAQLCTASLTSVRGSADELGRAATHGGCRLIEVRDDRTENLALHRHAAAAAVAALNRS